jgi:hypothetical protein
MAETLIFTEPFGKYASEGDTISAQHGGYTFTAQLKQDLFYGIDDDDCHNTDQAVTGCDDEQQTRLLHARKEYEKR